MPEREDQINALMGVLEAEPKPLTSARVLELARQQLPRIAADQFTKWFGPNGAHLLENLNGKP